jgi:hypothetical protein
MIERFIAVVSYYIKPKLKEEVSLLGNIFKQRFIWQTGYKEYLTYDTTKIQVFKVWNSR